MTAQALQDRRATIDEFPDILTPVQAARLMGQTPKTIRRMCEAGTIPSYRPEGSLKWLISKRKLMELIEGGER